MNKIDFLVLALSLIISTSAVLTYTLFFTDKWSEQYIKELKEKKQENEKKLLKDHINIIESLIKFHYEKLDENTIREYHERHLKNVINVAETMLRLKAENVAEKIRQKKSESVEPRKITQQNAQIQDMIHLAQLEAVADIKQIRYDAGKGYVWINDTTEPFPKMIMHPINPSLNGNIMSGSKYYRVLGKEEKNIFKHFVSIIKTNGEGFVEYISKSANLNIFEKKKLSYVKLFRDWNWIIGTSVFVDDDTYIMNDLKNKLKNAIRKMRYNDGKGYFVIIDFSDRKSPKYVMHPYDSKRENQELTGPFRKYKRRVESFIDTCDEMEDKTKKNEGYIEYKGSKPTSHGLFIQGAPKLTYVKCYEPLSWIIGSSFYKENMEMNIRKNEKYLNKQIEKLMRDVFIFAAASIIILVMFNYTINYLRRGTKDIKNGDDG
jgi:methyl-accepting chemotaxis protein